MTNKVAVIVTYFGTFPEYINFFFASCASNKDFDFLIFTDSSILLHRDWSNIKFFKSNFSVFNKLVAEKIGISADVKNGYKLVDFKPMYGLIYEDYLKPYNFWSYCDIDIVFGNIKTRFNDEFLENYDVIANHPLYMSGPFSLYRNIPEVNTLFLQSKDYERVILEDKVFAFDEVGPNAIQFLWQGVELSNVVCEIESITHLVKNNRNSNLRIIFTNFLLERLPLGSKLIWKDGILSDISGMEYSVFHFIIYKNSVLFNTPHLVNNNDLFFITDKGFFIDNISSYTSSWAKSIFYNLVKKVRIKLKHVFF